MIGNSFLQNVFSFLLLVFTAIPSGGFAADETPIPRKVIALYDGLSTESLDETQLHRLLEFPVNHLGLSLVYWDVAKDLPDSSALPSNLFVSWFQKPLINSEEFLAWAEEAHQQGARFAVLGHNGMTHLEERRWLALLGLEHHGFASVTHRSRITDWDPKLVGFECRPDPVLPPYPILKPATAEVTSHLSLTSDIPGLPKGSALVTTGPGGGRIAGGYALCRVPEIDRVRWLVNPFAFFEKAFGLPQRPIPDTTTLSGRRIYFSHIDGDGWGNRSEIAVGEESNPLAGRVLAEHLFKAYPDLPLGLGLVGGELDKSLSFVASEAIPLAREVLALPNVEVAAHGYSHPLRWGELELYDRAAEIAEIDEIRSRTTKPPALRGLDWVGGRLQKSPNDLRFFDGELPRVFASEPFSLENEIGDALDYATSLAPEGKEAKSFYWTGDALPFAEAIAMTRKLGVSNMNGGDSRYDGLYPSVAYLAPISRSPNGERQIYAGITNEVLFTDGWTKNFHGQIILEDTVKRTEAPRRLKPYNLYYHTFSGEKHASVRSLKRLHDLAQSQTFIPVWPSRYIAAADGFFSTRITRTGDREWQIENRGGLHTLRFDTDDAIYIDTSTSTGVIGLRRVNTSVYIALDSAVPVARLVLADAPDGAILLNNANWEFSDVRRDDCGIQAQVQGFGAGDLTFSNAERGPWHLTASRDGKVLANLIEHSNGKRLRFKLPDDVRAPLSIELSCQRGIAE